MMAKAKKKHTPKYTDEAVRALGRMSDSFNPIHHLLSALSQPGVLASLTPSPAPAQAPAAPAAPTPATTINTLSTRAWVAAEIERMKHAGEIHHSTPKAKVAQKLAERMIPAAAARNVKRAVDSRYIERRLKTWKLWPI
jgi:hypothetical protein